MNDSNKHRFDSEEFYKSYPDIVIGRIGYPARAVFKSTWMWKLFGENILREINTITTYADIGGCYGFGANAMAYYIDKRQGSRPRTTVIEISSSFIEIGQILFPHIEFIEADIAKCDKDLGMFDLVTLFDVVEHIDNPESFLKIIASHSKYIMLKTPLETSGEWRGSCPPEMQGAQHEDGHINFYTPKSYEKLLRDSGMGIISSRLVPTIVPIGGEILLCPEQHDFKITRWPVIFGRDISYSINDYMPINAIKKTKVFIAKVIRRFPIIPWRIKRKVLGYGDHLSLCKSHITG